MTSAGGTLPLTGAESIASFNGMVGDARSFDRLDDLLDQQAYRVAYCRTAADEINYRRFFDVNELAGLRIDDERVFDHVHQLVLQLVAEGVVTGLRLDHIDGLADPAAYLERLQAAIRLACGAESSPETWEPAFYVVVEKILSGDETLPHDWATAGTTGYNFLNAAGASTLGLEGVLTAFYGDPRTFTFGIDYNF